jgi:hypothetical protein
MTEKNFLTPDLKIVPMGTAPDGAKVYKTNFWELLAKNCVVPGLVDALGGGETDMDCAA